MIRRPGLLPPTSTRSFTNSASYSATLTLELEAVGWHVVGLRPSRTGEELALWRVTIERYDENVSMTVVEADPDIALAELVRYAQADAA